jgi:hypothetical protein
LSPLPTVTVIQLALLTAVQWQPEVVVTLIADGDAPPAGTLVLLVDDSV